MNRDKRAEYHPRWEVIVRWIHRRCKGQCEQCGVESYRYIRRGRKGKSYRYATDSELAQLATLTALGTKKNWGRRKALKYLKLTYVHLEVAHLDRNRANNEFANLRALCQSCHLNHDRPQHLRSRSYGRRHDRAHQLTLFTHEIRENDAL